MSTKRTDIVLEQIWMERCRQDEKWGEQNHPDGTAEALKEEADAARRDCDILASKGLVTWRHILAEEFWEALAETDPDKLQVELLQVASVCVNWIEAIDRRRILARDALQQSIGF